jgi:cytosine/adenosine deaminase-related metal-dependent hydrolase
MPEYKFGLIGDNLELKKNIRFDISDQRKIKNLTYEESDNQLDFTENADNFLLMPGLINSHIHIGDSFAKERGYDKGLIDVVAPPNGLKHLLLEKIPPEIKIKGIKQATLEMLSNGITYFMDFREEGTQGITIIKDALKDSSMKYQIYGRFNTIEQIEPIFQEADGIGLSSYRNINTPIKNELRKNKEKYKKLIACHHAEERRKPKLFELILNDDLVQILIHGTQLLGSDLKKLKQKKISLVLCPRCNGYFGVGFPPIEEIIKLNIPISIGTDNIMINSPNLFEEIRYLSLIYKVLNKANKKLYLSARELLKMITINAARNFRVQTQVGSIQEGKDADFFLINLNDPNYYSMPLTKDLIYPLIVQRTQTSNIKKVYINGEKIFERK